MRRMGWVAGELTGGESATQGEGEPDSFEGIRASISVGIAAGFTTWLDIATWPGRTGDCWTMQQSVAVIAGELQSSVMPRQQECCAGPDRHANPGIAAQKTTMASSSNRAMPLPMRIV